MTEGEKGRERERTREWSGGNKGRNEDRKKGVMPKLVSNRVKCWEGDAKNGGVKREGNE